MIDRKTPPPYSRITEIKLPQLENLKLKNGTEIFLLRSGTEDVVKIDLVFNAGSSLHPCPLVAGATNSMLTEGTTNHSGAELAEFFDFHGVLVQTSTDHDFGSLTLVTLTRFASEMVPLLAEITKKPTFPKNDLKVYLNKRKQNFLIASEKPKILAKRKFNEMIFGSSHPYGRIIQLSDFDNINIETLQDFHSRHYSPANCRIIVSGKFDSAVPELLNQHFGNNNWPVSKYTPFEKDVPEPFDLHKEFIEKPGAMQSAIQIGRLLFPKSHPDYQGMLVLNTILGGYFGSRLMTNIREEKAFTYGIGSSIVNLKNTNYFTIVTDVATEVANDAVKEIYIEIEKLRTDLVTHEELDRVRNYMAGEMLNLFDGPFAQSDSFRSLNDHGLEFDFYNELLHTIWHITDEQIRELARKYFQHDMLYEVIAGKSI